MNITEKVEVFAKKEYMKNDPKHQWKHVENVMEKALEIAKTVENVDHELLILGVIFHDVDYHSESSYQENYRNHVENSAGVAEGFLKRNNYPKERISKLKQIILDHSTPYRKKFGDSKITEGKILYDADKTASIRDESRKKLSPEKQEEIYNLLYFEKSRKILKP